MNAVCAEEIETLESNSKPAAAADAAAAAAAAAADAADAEIDNDLNSQPMEFDRKDFSPVSYVEAVEFLGRLRQSAPQLSVNEAARVHQDCFLKALRQRNQARTPLSICISPMSSCFG
jgi:hypothetical protein